MISHRFSRRLVQAAGIVSGLFVCSACTDFTGTPELPAGTNAPSAFETLDGAVALYGAAVAQATKGFANMVLVSGLFTDELKYSDVFSALTPVQQIGFESRVALRNTPEFGGPSGDYVYPFLQGIRGRSAQSLGVLAAQGDALPTSLRAELYALTAYAEVYLADLYCSGIPLSTLNYKGDYTYRSGSSTEDVYLHAVALFDTALGLAGDSVRITNLARVGKGRALLALGRFASADSAVRDVPPTFQYTHAVIWRRMASWGAEIGLIPTKFTVADREGSNGLSYLTMRDPRIAVDTVTYPTQPWLAPWPLPRKYSGTTVGSLVIANGIEAQLIAAEAALAGRTGTWLTVLNALRTNGSYTTAPHPTIPGQVDTLWQAGTGGVAQLKPLSDPGSDTARVTLLFRERAAWLYVTGHRQGDLRRLVRQYGRTEDTVYPTGIYPGSSAWFGDAVNLPVPNEEYANPLFTGCKDRHA